MKRDMELVKKILLEFEQLELNHTSDKIEINGYSQNEITYHAFLLQEAGLVEITDSSTLERKNFLPGRITWEGHEFLDNAKNDNIWNRTMKTVKEKGGSISFYVLKELLKSEATKHFDVLLNSIKI